jgi:hypothetical protein
MTQIRRSGIREWCFEADDGISSKEYDIEAKLDGLDIYGHTIPWDEIDQARKSLTPEVSAFDKWRNENHLQYSSDALHMSEYHMASVVRDAAKVLCLDAPTPIPQMSDERKAQLDKQWGSVITAQPAASIDETLKCGAFDRITHSDGRVEELTEAQYHASMAAAKKAIEGKPYGLKHSIAETQDLTNNIIALEFHKNKPTQTPK